VLSKAAVNQKQTTYLTVFNFNIHNGRMNSEANGLQTEVKVSRNGVPVRISSRLVLWRWHNNGSTWTLL